MLTITINQIKPKNLKVRITQFQSYQKKRIKKLSREPKVKNQ